MIDGWGIAQVDVLPCHEPLLVEAIEEKVFGLFLYVHANLKLTDNLFEPQELIKLYRSYLRAIKEVFHRKRPNHFQYIMVHVQLPSVENSNFRFGVMAKLFL